MPWLYTNNAVQEISDNVILYDLSKIRGTNAILSRVPQDFSGIYVWYRRFSFDQSAFDDPEAFVAAVLSELCKEHCAEREGQLPPMYRVSLKPETFFYKEDSLRKFASNETFRQLVLTLLENSLLFQQPMYIGKATNLYNRIRSHLREGSKLRERFNLAGHNIDQCRLLLVGMPPELSSQYNEQNSDFESELPEAGFKNNQNQTDYSIRGISRELFTDLNKNAKTVDRARELILDDRSINARCVRTILTEKTAEDSNNLVPLSLVRWQDDSNRFDTSYYLNSLVNLDLLVSNLLDLNPPRDPMEKNQVMAFLKSVNSALGIDGREVEYETRQLSRYYEEDCCDDDKEPHTPFSRLPDNYLESAVEGFKVNFRPWLLKLLLEFKPYKNLLTYARKNNLIEGAFGSFQAQTSKHKAIIREQETTRDSEWHIREILTPQQEIAKMKDEQWAFKAIFQKAMVRLGKIVEFQYRDEHLGDINDLLTFLDRLYDKGVLKVDAPLFDHPLRLWTFVALNPGNDKIKVAKTVEDKIFSLLCLWYFGSRKIELDAANNNWHTSTRKLLNFFSADKNTTQWPDCKKCFDTLYRGFDTNAFYGKDADQLSEHRKEELVQRGKNNPPV